MNDNNLDRLYSALESRTEKEKFVRTVKRIDSLVQELADLAGAANEWGEQNGHPEIENYPQHGRVQQLGKEFHNIAGHLGMQAALRSAQKKLGDYPPTNYTYAIIEYGWSGIGGWEP